MMIILFFPFCGLLLYLYVSHQIDNSQTSDRPGRDRKRNIKRQLSPSPSKYIIDTPAAEAIIRKHAKTEKIRARKGTPKPEKKETKFPTKRSKSSQNFDTGASPNTSRNVSPVKGRRLFDEADWISKK